MKTENTVTAALQTVASKLRIAADTNIVGDCVPLDNTFRYFVVGDLSGAAQILNDELTSNFVVKGGKVVGTDVNFSAKAGDYVVWSANSLDVYAASHFSKNFTTVFEG